MCGEWRDIYPFKKNCVLRKDIRQRKIFWGGFYSLILCLCCFPVLSIVLHSVQQRPQSQIPKVKTRPQSQSQFFTWQGTIGCPVSARPYLESVYKLLFLFLSCPKSVIGHPELTEKTGFWLIDCRNDRQTNRVYKQTLISPQITQIWKK